MRDLTRASLQPKLEEILCFLARTLFANAYLPRR